MFVCLSHSLRVNKYYFSNIYVNYSVRITGVHGIDYGAFVKPKRVDKFYF